LAEDKTYHGRSLPGDTLYLECSPVQVIADGTVDILVDEIEPGDASHDWSDGALLRLGRLFLASVPAGVTTLDDVPISVLRINPQPTE
jgi:hypothetical protein